MTPVNISEKWYNPLKIQNLPNTKHEKLIDDKNFNNNKRL